MFWQASKKKRVKGRGVPLLPRVPDGTTVYAIGDVHGRLDLLNKLLDLIVEDILKDQNKDEVILLFLGDYIDRGPDSRLVIETLCLLKKSAGHRVVMLRGNHEQAMLDFLLGVEDGVSWGQYGGRETLLSYGVAAPHGFPAKSEWADTRLKFAKAVPSDHVEFLRSLVLTASYGDYLFVHAGVRPGIPLAEQDSKDLLWIRDEFLTREHGLKSVVVHGHTPVEKPELERHRIGIDTGAYASGILTALKVRDSQQSFLQASSVASTDRGVSDTAVDKRRPITTRVG